MFYIFCCIVGRESHFGLGTECIFRSKMTSPSNMSVFGNIDPWNHINISTVLKSTCCILFKILRWGFHCSIKHFYQFANVSSFLYAHLEDLSPTNMWVVRRLGRMFFFFFVCVMWGGGGIIDFKTLSSRYCTFLKCRYSASSVLGIRWTLFHYISE